MKKVKVSGVVKVGQVRLDMRELSEIIGSDLLVAYFCDFIERVKNDLEGIKSEVYNEGYPDVVKKKVAYKCAEVDYKLEVLKEYLRGG